MKKIILCLTLFLLGCPQPQSTQPTLRPAVLNPHWEIIKAPNTAHYCERVEVPDGWLVYIRSYDQSPTATFIPDKEHQWLSVQKQVYFPERSK
jgi:hypothetical protein